MADVHRFVFTVETTCGEALACQKLVVQRVAEGFSPTHSTGAWEVDPLAVRSTAEVHAGNTKRAAFGIPSELYRGIARLEQHSKPALLGTGLPLLETPNPSRVDALDPDHQREEAHGTFWKSKNDPVPAWNCLLKRAGKTSRRLTRPLCQRAPGVSTRSCRSAATPSHFVEDAPRPRTRVSIPGLAVPNNTRPVAASGLRPPNLTELMSADRLLMAKIYQFVNKENWNLDDALHETNVRHDMVAVLQPRPRPSGRTTNERRQKTARKDATATSRRTYRKGRQEG